MGPAMSSVEVHPETAALRRPTAAAFVGFLRRPAVLALILFVATIAMYYPVHDHPFLNYDDRDYVYENSHVQSGLTWASVRWAFTTTAAGNWHPLTWLSHELDCQLFGLDPAAHHDVNVVLHALNAALLFWVLSQATGFAGRSFMVAALFALHPINVESVAWVAERKNMLSTLFFLLALGAYRWYAARPDIARYGLVTLLFALGLMAKPQIITLPFVFLLWDYWPLERIALRHSRNAIRHSLFAFGQSGESSFSGEERTANGERRSSGEERRATSAQRSVLWLILEKVPLFLLVIASAVITLHAQHLAREYYPRLLRVGNGILSYALYLKQAVWPTGLTLLYPHPDHLSLPTVLLSGALLLSITILAFVGWRHRYLPVGWLWFLGTLIPMLGLVQVGVQARADRYAYVSFIGVFIIVCWGLTEVANSLHLPQLVLPFAGLVALLVLAVFTRLQIDYWQSDEVVWRHALQVTSGNWIAESQMGTALAIDGRVEEAVPHFYRALALQPEDIDANMAIAIYQLRRRNYSEAIVYYKRVVAVKHPPRVGMVVNAWMGMAKAYFALGDKAEAQECLRAAKQLNNNAEFAN